MFNTQPMPLKDILSDISTGIIQLPVRGPRPDGRFS